MPAQLTGEAGALRAALHAPRVAAAGRRPRGLLLLGHSMGGVVARAALGRAVGVKQLGGWRGAVLCRWLGAGAWLL